MTTEPDISELIDWRGPSAERAAREAATATATVPATASMAVPAPSGGPGGRAPASCAATTTATRPEPVQRADDLVGDGICVRCGHSHLPEDRRRAVHRMLPATFETIRQAWPCFYEGTAGAKRLQRDLEALGAVYGGSVFWKGMWHLPEDAAAPAEPQEPAGAQQRPEEAQELLAEFADACESEAALRRRLDEAHGRQLELLGQLQAMGVRARYAARRWVLAHGGNPRDATAVRRAAELLRLRSLRSSSVR